MLLLPSCSSRVEQSPQSRAVAIRDDPAAPPGEVNGIILEICSSNPPSTSIASIAAKNEMTEGAARPKRRSHNAARQK